MYNSRCLEFYYFMSGKQEWNGTLELFIKSPHAPPLISTWTKTGPSVYAWQFAQGYVHITGNFDVSIQLQFCKISCI